MIRAFNHVDVDEYGRILCPSKDSSTPPDLPSPSPQKSSSTPQALSSPHQSSSTLPALSSQQSSSTQPALSSPLPIHPSSSTTISTTSLSSSPSPIRTMRPSTSRQIYGESQGGKGRGKGGLSMKVNQKKLTIEYNKVDRAAQLQDWNKWKTEYTLHINNILKKNRSASDLQCPDCTKFISTKTYLKHRTKSCKNLNDKLTFYKFRKIEYDQ